MSSGASLSSFILFKTKEQQYLLNKNSKESEKNKK